MKKEVRVLILEDVATDVILINHELRKGGIAFRSKRVDSRDGFVYELQHHTPDIILSDHGLPEFDGFSALAIAHDRCPDVPFIFVTGSLGEEVAIETFKSGATDYVLKSRLATNLVPAVQRALREAGERARLKQTEHDLRESETRFRMLVEGVRDYAICMLDVNGRITSWNPGAEYIYRYSSGEILGQNFSCFYPRDDAALGKPAADLKTAAVEGRHEEEGWRMRKGAVPYWANVVIFSLRDSTGKLRGFAHVTRDFTERKQVADALQQSESRKAAILDTALDAIVSIDKSGVIQEWNSAAEKMFGYQRDEAMGREMAELIIPAVLRDKHRHGLADYLATARSRILGRPVELTALRANGSIFPVEVIISRIPNATPPMFTGFIRDISGRKEAEEALKKTQARKTAILDTALDAVITINHQGVVEEWNPAAEKLFGYPRAHALHHHLDDLIIPQSLREDYRDSLAEYLTTGVGSLLGRPIDITLRRADQGEFQAELAITRISAEEPPIYTSFIRDVTDRKRAAEEMRKSEERYRMLVENVEDYAIYLLDPAGRIVTWNAGAERIEGYTTEEILGHHFSRMYSAEDIARGRPDEVLKIATSQGQFREEAWRVRKDGSRYWASVTITALRNEAGELYGFSKIHRDITKRKEAEDEIRRLNADLENRVIERTAQLEAANKELEAFSYSVSHDLRAPLRHINGFVDMLLAQAQGLAPEDRQIVQTIADSAKQMGELIDDLLAFSRMGRDEMHRLPVNLADLVQSARNSLRRDCQGRDIDWQVGPLPEVHGDSNMLRQVLINLLANAVKYTRPRARARIEISSTASPAETTVCIRDNGVGFDMKYVDKLFGVFQRLHRARDFEGTGIGLANVRRIISRHGGRTWAEGRVNEGAAFFFSLPKQNGGTYGTHQKNPAGG